MKIIVDCNSDRITIDKIEMICINPYRTIKILEEIFNNLDESRLAAATGYTFDIELVMIDEDITTTIGEW